MKVQEVAFLFTLFYYRMFTKRATFRKKNICCLVIIK